MHNSATQPMIILPQSRSLLMVMPYLPVSFPRIGFTSFIVCPMVCSPPIRLQDCDRHPFQWYSTQSRKFCCRSLYHDITPVTFMGYRQTRPDPTPFNESPPPALADDANTLHASRSAICFSRPDRCSHSIVVVPGIATYEDYEL
jgi:hypothetical protein